MLYHYQSILIFFFNDTATTEIYTLSLHDALPILPLACGGADAPSNMQWQTTEDAKAKDKVERQGCSTLSFAFASSVVRSEEHTSELQSRLHLVCRLLLEKKKIKFFII